mgnify:CR=1 FL=1
MAEWPVGRRGLAILLWATDPKDPERCVTPFFHAAAAAAMEVEVEVFFAARSVHLLTPEGANRATADAMREAVRHGVRFYACSQALQAQGIDRSRVLSEVAGIAGAAAFVARVLDPNWSSLTF